MTDLSRELWNKRFKDMLKSSVPKFIYSSPNGTREEVEKIAYLIFNQTIIAGRLSERCNELDVQEITSIHNNVLSDILDIHFGKSKIL